MQDAKADDKSKKELENWLKRPETSSNPEMASGSIDDLLWLQAHSKDLSCVDLNAKKNPVHVTETEVKPEKKEKATPKSKDENSPVRNTTGGSSGGGFTSLFASCTGKRK